MHKTNPLIIIWHAYIIRGYLNYRYDVHTMVDEPKIQLLKSYLSATLGNDEWVKLQILETIKNKTRKQMKKEAKRCLRSLFDKKRPAYPIKQPLELPDLHINVEAIKEFGVALLKLKAERENEIDTEEGVREMDNVDLNGVMIPITKFVGDGTKTKSGKERKIPKVIHVNAGELTLDNFREKTGRKFRMTKGQVDRLGQHARRQAFEEFLREAAKAAYNKNEE